METMCEEMIDLHGTDDLTNDRTLAVDVLVVGAGLAGCSFGYLMRKRGFTVLLAELLDAGQKEKLCGGVLAHEAESLFAQIYGPEVLDGLGALRLDRIDLLSLDKVFPLPFSGLALSRKRLDDFCLRSYLDSGGVLRDRVSLRHIDAPAHRARFLDVRTNREFEVTYGILVGADGAGSKVRKLLSGRIGNSFLSVEGRVAARGESILCEVFPGEDGLCWYIPNGLDANVGCLFYNLDVTRCRERLRLFCKREGHMPGKLRQALIPEGDDVLLQAGQDAYLVGDAAGLAEGFGGSGMHFALRSSIALADYLGGGPAYETSMQPIISQLARVARDRGSRYFRTAVLVAVRGVKRGDRSSRSHV